MGPERLEREVADRRGAREIGRVEQHEQGRREVLEHEERVVVVDDGPRRREAAPDVEVAERAVAEQRAALAEDDELVGVNGLAVDRLKFNESIELIRSAEWPLAVRFRRPALGDSMKLFSNWSANALKHALLEADADVRAGKW